MPENNFLRIFFHVDSQTDAGMLRKNLTSLETCAIPHELVICNYPVHQPVIEDICATLSPNAQRRKLERVLIENSDNWHACANRLFQQSGQLGHGSSYHGQINERFISNAEQERGGYVFFISAHVKINADALKALIAELERDQQLAGVNPLFLDGYGHVHHLGTVADSLCRIHFLYEGIEADSGLAAKKRRFQLAHEPAFMMRFRDFWAAHGFNANRGELTFTDFCLRLRVDKNACYTSVPDVPAILDDKYDSWKTCGLWNSLLLRGKLAPNLLKPDYHEHAIADGLEYGVTEWLEEGVSVLPENKEYFPWLEWRRDPKPKTLLAFLASLPQAEMRQAISLCRFLPSTLPRAFAYYEYAAECLETFARRQNLRKMQTQAGQWQKKKRIFHYSSLKTGIKTLAKAGVYKASLDAMPAVYDAWLELSENAQFARMEIGRDWPAIAVAMPVWNGSADFLRQAVQSVISQSYGNWELCIADDASTDSRIKELLLALAREDARIRLVFRDENGHISRASNSALTLVNAPWTAFMDHDDLLAEDALAHLAELAASRDELRMIYSDEDHIDEFNVRRTPIFKPDFDPYLHFTGHLSCYRTDAVLASGGFRAGYEGSQDFDLSLRLSETLNANQIAHIPRILYHWRVHAQSTSSSIATKPYALKATARAWEDSARRKGFTAKACPTEKNNFFNLAYELPRELKCSLILLAENGDISEQLIQCLNCLNQTMDVELCWQPLAKNVRPPASLLNIAWKKAQSLPFAGAWTSAYQAAAAQASHELLLFIHSSLVPLANCHPEQLVFLAQRQELAAVGSLIWKNGHLWHGGLYPDVTGLPFPLLRGIDKNLVPAYCWGQFLLLRKVIGVSWSCMASRKEILSQKDLFNKEMGEHICADFSLKEEQKGRYTVVSPWGQWETRQPEPESGAKDADKCFHAQWGNTVLNHGLRNRNMRSATDYDWTLIL